MEMKVMSDKSQIAKDIRRMSREEEMRLRREEGIEFKSKSWTNLPSRKTERHKLKQKLNEVSYNNYEDFDNYD